MDPLIVSIAPVRMACYLALAVSVMYETDCQPLLQGNSLLFYFVYSYPSSPA